MQTADIILDFETYYDPQTKYSLSSLTYEEYIRDPRFQIIMCSFKIRSTNELYYVIGEDEVWKELDRLQISKYSICAHNMHFDGMIVTDLLDFIPREYYCSLVMAGRVEAGGVPLSLAKLAQRHQLQSKGMYVHDMQGKRLEHMSHAELKHYGDYCLTDTVLGEKLYEIYRPHFSDQDMSLMSATLRMHCDPFFEVDTPLVAAYIPELKRKRESYLVSLAEEQGLTLDQMRTKLRSSKSFAPMLEAFGVEAPRKISKTTGKETYAFAKDDGDFKDLLDHPDPRVAALVEAKIGVGSSQAETRAKRFLDIGSRGPLPFSLKPWGAHTGRDAATQKINMQNLPSRGADKTLRRSVIAKEGHVVVACDLSQIEARRLADLAGQTDLLDQFRYGQDPYSLFATALYGYPVGKGLGTDTERTVGKECILSLGFGAGAKSFRTRLKGAYGIDLSEEMAEAAVKLYRSTNRQITAFWRECDEAIKTMVYGGSYRFGRGGELHAEKDKITLADGFILHYEKCKEIEPDENGRPQYMYYNREKRAEKKVYSGLVANNVTQGSAGRILQYHTHRIRMETNLILRGKIHDELLACPRLDELECAKTIMTSYMRMSPPWAMGTPLDCEFECGWNLADMMSYEKFIETQLSGEAF